MKKIGLSLLSLLVLVSMTGCKKKEEQPAEQTTAVVEETVFASPLFKAEKIDEEFLTYGKNLNEVWTPEGVIGVGESGVTQVAKIGDYYVNENLGIYYDVDMATIRGGSEADIRLLGVFQDTVVVMERVDGESEQEVTWEYVNINGGKVLKFYGVYSFDFTGYKDSAYVAIGDSVSISGSFGTNVYMFEMKESERVENLGKVEELLPRGYTIKPMTQVISVSNKKYIVTRSKIFEVNDGELDDTGIDFTTNNRSIASYFIVQHNKIYAIGFINGKNTLYQWSSDWDLQAEYALLDEGDIMINRDTFNRYSATAIDDNTIAFVRADNLEDEKTEIIGFIFSTKDNKVTQEIRYTIEDKMVI